MAMTKKEQAAMQAAIDRAEALAALRWTAPVAPDVPIPEPGGAFVTGWTYNEYAREVRPAWSSSVSHGTSTEPGRHGTQGPLALYSTRTRALQALRHALELQAAAKLLAVDRAISGREGE